jgi:D-alanyl-lipoteichoic acid acyltransferase DltB (MBOAT superfamily)
VLIGRARKKSIKVFALILGLITNLGLLVYFKYAYFFNDLLNRFTGDAFETYNWLAHWWNVVSGASINTMDIILPVGISFFTFQAISYLVDVYKERTEVVRNIFDFSFYLSFFPQLVAGPIVRASSFIPQLYRPYQLSKSEFGHALFLILAGLLKKIMISDYLAISFIDRVFEQPGSFAGSENLLAIYAYALQIYCDFSGYTDIAIGVALLLGFKLPVNFNSPYKAVSLSDFWHRWHISLSTWLRDYLYIPLGGNRKGKARTYLNLFLTMVLGGLWHGANIRYVLWGAFHGFGLIIEKLFRSLRFSFPDGRLKQLVGGFFTFHFVCFGWLLFRADSIGRVGEMGYQIIHLFHGEVIFQFIVAYPMVFVILLLGFVAHWFPSKGHEVVRGKFIEQSLWVEGLIVLGVLFVLHLFIQSDLQPFIYFRF